MNNAIIGLTGVVFGVLGTIVFFLLQGQLSDRFEADYFIGQVQSVEDPFIEIRVIPETRAPNEGEIVKLHIGAYAQMASRNKMNMPRIGELYFFYYADLASSEGKALNSFSPLFPESENPVSTKLENF